MTTGDWTEPNLMASFALPAELAISVSQEPDQVPVEIGDYLWRRFGVHYEPEA